MKGVCPECEQVSDLEPLQKDIEMVVRGEPVEITTELLRCLSCGEEFKDLKSDVDLLDLAYREYRNRHNMLMPEEIRDLRKHYGLTQNEMSSLLGWGGATLSRFENGALQSDAHEIMLRMIIEPGNLKKLLEENPGTIVEEKRAALIRKLTAETELDLSPARICIKWLGNQEPDEFSGFREFDPDKLSNLILFLSRGDGVFKTKLNKLLFYSDFTHFRKTASSITGARYVRLPLGPVPDKYELLYALLAMQGAIDIKEIVFKEDVAGDRIFAKQEPDLSVFSDSELSVITFIKDYFKDFSCRRIVDFSHAEKGYRETTELGEISYEFANELQLSLR